jgi:hypothetical protein
MHETVQRILATSERINIKLQRALDISTDIEHKLVKLISDTKERNKILELHGIQIQELAKATGTTLSV